MTISCDEAMWLLSRKLDDKITEKDVKVLDEHIQSCAQCQERLKWVGKAEQVVGSAIRNLSLTKGICEDAMESIKLHQAVKKGGFRLWHLLLILGVVVVALVAIWLFLLGGSGK
ncbi:MAG: zf-HC2 domain-containing protein [Planctomycetota bacterium]|nr:zf-HC2 domain-containing protein [Planctomycetota bacterium]